MEDELKEERRCECGESSDLLRCDECHDVCCHDCNDELMIFFSCYVCQKITCESCDGCHFCDFCGCQENYLCKDHIVRIEGFDKVGCIRKECRAICEYLSSNGEDTERWDQLIKDLQALEE